MAQLTNWYLKKDAGVKSSAHGVVSGHDQLPDGSMVHTDRLQEIRFKEQEMRLTLLTRSGEHYDLDVSAIDITKTDETREVLVMFGIHAYFLGFCAELAADRILKSRELLWIFDYDRAFFKDAQGRVQTISLRTHLSILDDAVLVTDWENGEVNFRYFPNGNSTVAVEPCCWSDGLNAVLIDNRAVKEIEFIGTGRTIHCRPGEITRIESMEGVCHGSGGKEEAKLLGVVQMVPKWRIDWEVIENSRLAPYIREMKETPQNPLYHAEGDVWTHTRMVCEEIVALMASEEYRRLGRRKQEELFLAALLHDIGKIKCTRLESGVWTSPNHTVVGSQMAREILWRECGFRGTEELQRFRETVCALIRYHASPTHILEQKCPERRLIRMASAGELTQDFSLDLLCILARADLRGRIYDADEKDRLFKMVDFCIDRAWEVRCLWHPREIPSAFLKYAYFEGRTTLPGEVLRDDTWGEVILVCGLPTPAKTVWIREHYGSYPVASSDESAGGYLREKVPFVWEDAGLTPSVRRKRVSRAVNSGASVKIVWVEGRWEEQMESAMPPEQFEAHRVEWHCI